MNIVRIFLCCIVLLCGCQESKKVTFMTGGTPSDFTFWEETIAEFYEKTGISVELIRSATQTEMRKQQIFVALRGKKPDPDIIVMDIAWIGQLAASDWLFPLQSFDIDTSLFFNNIITLADMHNDQVIALPLFVDAGLFYYRKDLLEKYGYPAPPETWDELITMSQNIQGKERKTNKNFWGYVWQGAQYEGLVCNALEVFTSCGGSFMTDDNRGNFSTAQNIKALSYMVDFIHTYTISPPNTYTDMKEEEVRTIFHNGNALFQRNWPYAARLHEKSDSKVSGKFGMTVIPHSLGGRSAATLGGWHIGISKYSDNKKAAGEFIQFLTSYEIQKKQQKQLGYNPGRKDIYDDSELDNPYLKELKAILLTAVPRPMVPYYSQLSIVMQKYFNNALAKKMSPDEALKAVQKEVERVTSEYAAP